MSIEKLINSVADQDFSAAGPTFNELMQSRIADALEQEKISVAAQIFNNADEEQLEMDLDDDISDEDLDDAIEETEDDDEE